MLLDVVIAHSVAEVVVAVCAYRVSLLGVGCVEEEEMGERFAPAPLFSKENSRSVPREKKSGADAAARPGLPRND